MAAPRSPRWSVVGCITRRRRMYKSHLLRDYLITLFVKPYSFLDVIPAFFQEEVCIDLLLF